MKRTASELLMTLTALMVIATFASAATDSDSLRERLVKSDSTDLVYAVDGYHTFVVGDVSAVSGQEADFTVVKRYGKEAGLPENSYLIRHNTPQPFLYKGTVLPAYDRVGELRGTVRIAEAPLGEGGYGILDLFEHAKALCNKKGGSAVYVVPKMNGKYKLLTEVRAEEAFDYMLRSAGRNGAWYMACEGKKKFLVTKNYTFEGKRASVDVLPGRGLEGVDYVKDGYRVPERTMLAESKPLDEPGFIKKMAWEVATVRNDFLKSRDGSRYIGFYNGRYNVSGCEWVSIKHLDSAKVPGEFTAKIYDFKVCGDKVASLGQSEERVAAGNLRDLYKRPAKGMLARNSK